MANFFLIFANRKIFFKITTLGKFSTKAVLALVHIIHVCQYPWWEKMLLPLIKIQGASGIKFNFLKTLDFLSVFNVIDSIWCRPFEKNFQLQFSYLKLMLFHCSIPMDLCIYIGDSNNNNNNNNNNNKTQPPASIVSRLHSYFIFLISKSPFLLYAFMLLSHTL